MRIIHAYHCYADGAWHEPLAEHLAALEEAEFDGEFLVGVVGHPIRRAEVRHQLEVIRWPDRFIEADTGWEQVTLNLVHITAKLNPGTIIYAHTKGAAHPATHQDAWRRSMTHQLITRWRNVADLLSTGETDAVGCHWLTEPDRMFGGNFWAATCDYLRQLAPPGDSTRHQAETWIGEGDPRVIDLFPGWPGTVAFPRLKIRRLIAG